MIFRRDNEFDTVTWDNLPQGVVFLSFSFFLCDEFNLSWLIKFQ
jgi:hypothetical protein